MQEPVLIQPIETMQSPKRVVTERRTTVIWLHPLDECLRKGVYASYLDESTTGRRTPMPISLMKGGPAGPLLPLPAFIPEDRELARLSEVIGQRLGVPAGEFIGQEIERRAKVVQALADHQGKWIGGWLRSGSNHADVGRAIGFRLEPDAFVTRLDDLLHEGIEVLQCWCARFNFKMEPRSRSMGPTLSMIERKDRRANLKNPATLSDPRYSVVPVR
jgi:hypothetical protein